MADEQLLDVRPALASIEKLNKAFESVSSYAQKFENAINNGVLNPLNKSLTSFDKTAKDTDNLSKSFTTIADSIHSAFKELNKVSAEGSAITKLKSMVTDLSEIGKIDSAGNFANLSKSFQQLGNGLSTLSNITANTGGLGNVLDSVRSLQSTFNKVRVVQSLPLVNSKGSKNDQISFLKSSVESVQEVSTTLQKFSGAVNNLQKTSDSITGGNVAESAKMAFGLIADLLNRINTFSYNIPVSKGNTDSYILFSKTSLDIIRSVNNTLSSFSKSIQELKTASSTITGEGVADSIETAFLVVSDIVNRVSLVTDSSMLRLNSNFEFSKASVEALDAIQKSLSAFAKAMQGLQNAAKGINNPNTVQQIEFSIAYIEDLFKRINVAWNPNTVGSGTPTYSFSSKNLLDVKEIADALNGMVKSFKSFPKVDKMQEYEASIQKALAIVTQMKQAAEPIRTLVTDLSGLSSMNVMPHVDKQGNVNYKLVESVDSKTKLFSNVVSAIKKMIPVVESLHGLKVDGVSAKLDELRTSIPKLFESFSELGNKITIDDGSKKGKTMFSSNITNSFVNVVNVLKNFVKTITKLPDLEKMGTFDFKGITTNIKSFIQEMGKLASSGDFYKFESLANSMYLVSNASKNLVTSTKKAKSAIRAVSDTADSSTSSINNITASFKQLFSAFVGGSVIYSIVRGIKDATKSLVELEYEMAAVNTIARASETVLTSMTSQVLSMSSTWGVAKKELTKALYEINSATITGADAMVVLEASVKAARAGFTDVSKTADIMSKIIKAYGYTAYDSAYISDVLFTTVERGINTMEQLSQYMGRVLTGAANAGVSFEEVAASIATMTTRGLQTNIATTALNSMILKLAGNSKKLNEVFKKYGYETSAIALRTLGLQKTIKILKDETQGHTDALAKLGFNYRDIRAATVLASDALSEYEKTMNIFKESANGASATERALQTVMETTQVKWDKLKKSVENYFIALQDSISANTHIKDALDAITKVVKYLTDAYKSSWSEMTTMQTVVVTLTTAITDLLIVSAVTSAFLGVHKAIKGVTSGISFLIKRIYVYCRLMRRTIAVNTASGVSLKALAASFKVATLAATAFSVTVTAGIAAIVALGYALYKAHKELSEFSKNNNISLDLGVQSSMDADIVLLTTKAGLLKKAFRESIGKSTEEYNRAKENLLQFDAALQKLISSGKVSGSAFTGMSKAIQKLVSEADKNPSRKLIEGFEQFDNVVKQNESSITKLIDKIAQIDKTPVGKSFGAFEKYTKFADAQAGMRDVVQRMEEAKEKFNALNVMSDGNKVTIDNAEAFLQGKGQANALSALNKHVAGIPNKYADLLSSIPDAANFSVIKKLMEDFYHSSQTLKKSFNISKMDYLLNEAFGDIGIVRKLEAKISKEPTNTAKWYARQGLVNDFERPLTQLGAAGVAPNEYGLLESTALSYKRSTSALSKLGFNYNIKDGLSLKNQELQKKISWNWDSSKDVKSNIEALSKAFSDFKGSLTKTESDLQTSITKMAAEYKKHAEEFAKQLPKILQEADKMAQTIFNAGKKALTLPEQITNLQNRYNSMSSSNKEALNQIKSKSTAEEAGRAMRELIKNTSKADLPKLLNDISVFTDLQKAQIQYKNALTKQKDALNKSLTQMKVDKMVDPISYYRSQFNKAFANVKALSAKGLLDEHSLEQFNEARTNYYNSLKQRVSYQSSPAMGQTQAIKAGSQEAQSLLSRGVFATKYDTDKGILKSTKDVSAKTREVAGLVSKILAKIENGSITILTGS